MKIQKLPQIVIACLAVLLLWSGSAVPTLAQAAQYSGAWKSVPCDTLNIAPSVAAVADCGYVTVTENRANGGDKFIQLAVVRVKSTSANPGAPMFIGTGGPGGYGFTNIQLATEGLGWVQANAGILSDRDMVFFTQRGTTGSKPTLECQDYDFIEFRTALEAMTEDQVAAEITRTLTACRDTFVAAGVDLSAYNSNENAADINDIRQALGYDKIIYYGQSYGTLLGQYLMRNHANILESVILDGVARAIPTRYAEMVNLQFSFRQLFAACEADAVCNAAYPNLEATLTEVYDALQKQPMVLPVVLGGEDATLTVNGNMIMAGLFGAMYGDPSSVPSRIAALKGSNALAVRQLAPSLPSPLNPFARIQHFAINCSDDKITSPEPAYEDLLPMYTNMARLDNLPEALSCQVLNVPQLPDASDAPVVSDLPVLILNGSLDPATPLPNGEEVAKTLTNHQLIVVQGGGHVQNHLPCVLNIMQAFMKDPTAQVDTTCLPAQPEFQVPYQAVVDPANDMEGVSLELPAGFATLAGGVWGPRNAHQQFVLGRMSVSTSVEDAMKSTVKALSYEAAFADVSAVDGPAIDGNPTKVLHAIVEGQGSSTAVTVYGFQTEKTTFVFVWINSDAEAEEDYQQAVVGPLLQSIRITQ